MKKIEDSCKLIEIMEKLPAEKGKMWCSSTIGFGNYHCKHENRREGDLFRIGFSTRKSAFSLYVIPCGEGGQNDLVSKLGKMKMRKAACIYFKKCIDLDVVEELMKESLGRNC